MKKNEWQDIKGEKYRDYLWADGYKHTVNQATALRVSDSGGHRLKTASGVNVYIPPGWRVIRFVGEWLV